MSGPLQLRGGAGWVKRPGCGLRPGAVSWGTLWRRPGTQQPQCGDVGRRMRNRPVRGSKCSSGNDRGCHKGTCVQVHFQSAQGGGSSGAPTACMGWPVGVGGKLGPHAQLRGHRPAASWMVPLRPTAIPGRNCVSLLEHCAVSAPQRPLCLRRQEANPLLPSPRLHRVTDDCTSTSQKNWSWQ